MRVVSNANSGGILAKMGCVLALENNAKTSMKWGTVHHVSKTIN